MKEALQENLRQIFTIEKAKVVAELPTLLSFAEFCAKYGMSVKTLSSWTKKKDKPYFLVKIGKMNFVDVDLFKQYLKEQSPKKSLFR